jgi:hypothetical protein
MLFEQRTDLSYNLIWTYIEMTILSDLFLSSPNLGVGDGEYSLVGPSLFLFPLHEIMWGTAYTFYFYHTSPPPPSIYSCEWGWKIGWLGPSLSFIFANAQTGTGDMGQPLQMKNWHISLCPMLQTPKTFQPKLILALSVTVSYPLFPYYPKSCFYFSPLIQDPTFPLQQT